MGGIVPPHAFLALRNGGEPLAQPMPRFGTDSVTMLCLNCGVSTTYPLGEGEVGAATSLPDRDAQPSPELAQPIGHAQGMAAARDRLLIDLSNPFSSDPSPARRKPTSLRMEETLPAVGFCFPGRILLGAIPDFPVCAGAIYQSVERNGPPKAAPLPAPHCPPAVGGGGSEVTAP